MTISMCLRFILGHGAPEPENIEPGHIQTHPIVAPQKQSSLIVPNENSVQPPSVEDSPDATMAHHSFQRGSSAGDRLFKELRDARMKGLEDHTYFVPLSEIQSLVTVSKIEQIIRDEHPHMNAATARTHAENAETSAKRLFANLALHRKGGTICSLLESRVSDQDLPFHRKKTPDGSWSLWLAKPEKVRIQAFDGWESWDIEEFERTQWWMMAPVFDKACRDCRELADLAILPFCPVKGHGSEDGEEDDGDIEENTERNAVLYSAQKNMGRDVAKRAGIPVMKNGGYSEVNAYRPHPAHHNFWSISTPFTRQPLIADKKLNDDDRLDFLKEKSILDALGPLQHNHLIQLLSSYRKKKHYHLIFPCADSNLRIYWEHNESPIFDKRTALWSVRQMYGITSALFAIHNFEVKFDLDISGGVRVQEGGAKLILKAGEEKYGRHGDIKPENILWFKEQNVLKVTDFGLGRFHGRDSRSGIDPRKIQGTLTYEPPECSLARGVSRKYDIWSLGCLFLEFITWLLEGAEAINTFANERGLDTGFINDDTFFTVFTDSNLEKDANVREGVIRWVDRLHTHEKCSLLIHDLLDLVMKSMLQVDPDDRKSAKDLEEEMKKLVERTERSDAYLVKAAPRPASIPPPDTKPSTGQRVRFAE